MEPDEAAVETEASFIVENSLTGNSLTGNSLTGNSLTGNSLLAHALTESSIVDNPLVSEALEDPDARLVLQFITSCALPDDAHFDVEIDGVTYGFDGDLNLAPEWGEEDGSCDDKCRQWVSACVLSRVNYLGEHMPISIRGSHESLGSSRYERLTYPLREAAYYGNIFSVPQKLYACLSPDTTQIPRVCGPSIDDCLVEVTGSCDDVCKNPKQDGSFPKCRVPNELEASSHHGGTTYVGSVTVFLKLH